MKLKTRAVVVPRRRGQPSLLALLTTHPGQFSLLETGGLRSYCSKYVLTRTMYSSFKALSPIGCCCLALVLCSTAIASPLQADDRNRFPTNRMGAGTRGPKSMQDTEEIFIPELGETSPPKEKNSLDNGKSSELQISK